MFRDCSTLQMIEVRDSDLPVDVLRNRDRDFRVLEVFEEGAALLQPVIGEAHDRVLVVTDVCPRDLQASWSRIIGVIGFRKVNNGLVYRFTVMGNKVRLPNIEGK